MHEAMLGVNDEDTIRQRCEEKQSMVFDAVHCKLAFGADLGVEFPGYCQALLSVGRLEDHIWLVGCFPTTLGMRLLLVNGQEVNVAAKAAASSFIFGPLAAKQPQLCEPKFIEGPNEGAKSARLIENVLHELALVKELTTLASCILLSICLSRNRFKGPMRPTTLTTLTTMLTLSVSTAKPAVCAKKPGACGTTTFGGVKSMSGKAVPSLASSASQPPRNTSSATANGELVWLAAALPYFVEIALRSCASHALYSSRLTKPRTSTFTEDCAFAILLE
eukprot:CAMPEP_0115166520 /NCGR_PEP_ID=MMETSP0227-20121206/74169_1 /TAXON_ID=89957 /ORGANISM="Polarella glacialis, Strain CCMP 1383" /LENGTH=276 /DNA_ID=CAMNT_0002579063 /DNA_START=274 /DNA_END=1103 /DNA_ORIENTATION=-